MSKGRKRTRRNASSVQIDRVSHGGTERSGAPIDSVEAIPERKGNIGQPKMKRFVVEVQLFPPTGPWKPSTNKYGAYFATQKEAEEIAQKYREFIGGDSLSYRVRDTQSSIGIVEGTRTGRTTWDTGTYWERDKNRAKNAPIIDPDDAYLIERSTQVLDVVNMDFSNIEKRICNSLLEAPKENTVESKLKKIVFVKPDNANEVRLTSSLLVDADGELNLIINNVKILRITAEGVLRRYINTEIAKLGLAVEANQIALGS